MSHLILELALWILLAFFIGCIIGCLLRRLFGSGTDVATVEGPANVVTESPATIEAERPSRIAAERSERKAAAAETMEEPLPLTGKPAKPKAPVATTEEPLPPASKPAKPKAPAAAPEEPLPLTGKPARPKGIAAARTGKADNLQRISGVGPKNEKTLHGLGFFHFDQIAAWTADEVAWVDEHLKFNGRILREKWTEQARLLADGKEEEFRKLYGTGGLRNKKGETESGTQTRKS